MNILVVENQVLNVDSSILELLAEKREQVRKDESVWKYHLLPLTHQLQELSKDHIRLNKFCEIARLKNYNYIILT